MHRYILYRSNYSQIGFFDVGLCRLPGDFVKTGNMSSSGNFTNCVVTVGHYFNRGLVVVILLKLSFSADNDT